MRLRNWKLHAQYLNFANHPNFAIYESVISVFTILINILIQIVMWQLMSCCFLQRIIHN